MRYLIGGHSVVDVARPSGLWQISTIDQLPKRAVCGLDLNDRKGSVGIAFFG